jgi:hypothetical protein
MAELELNLKEKIIYKSFKTQKELNTFILDYIFESKADKILFKGDPYDLTYKEMKKMIDESNFLMKDGDVRNAFRKVIQLSGNEPYCVIYKLENKNT